MGAPPAFSIAVYCNIRGHYDIITVVPNNSYYRAGGSSSGIGVLQVSCIVLKVRVNFQAQGIHVLHTSSFYWAVAFLGAALQFHVKLWECTKAPLRACRNLKNLCSLLGSRFK